MRTCAICGRPVCAQCVHSAYGREFCGIGCAGFFFYGDTEEGGEAS
jgi:hypothetical protein